MARAKLSGSLLACKDAPPAINSAQDLGAAGLGADEKAPGGPVLVWSTRPKNAAEPDTEEDTAEDTDGAGCRAPASPPATDLDPPVAGVIAGTASCTAADTQSGRPDILRPARRWPVSRAVAVAVSILAVGSVIDSLLLAPSGATYSGETAFSVASPASAEKLASGVVGPELRLPAKAATPSSDAARTAPIVASADPAVPADASPRVPKVSGGTPGANRPVGAANSSTAPTEPPTSAALYSALLERGDSLFVTGDFSSARLLYERAANAGHGYAALRLGETYDPAFLAPTRFNVARANAAMATYWYQRAQELGVPEAEILIKAIAGETDHGSP